MLSCGKHCTTMQVGLFQDSDFAGDLEDSKSTSGRILRIFGSHTFVPVCWMCKKQTSVSHRSTESEDISLDTRLRMDGIPAIDLWDLIFQVFHSFPIQFTQPKDSAQGYLLRDTSSNKHTNIQTKKSIQHDDLELCNVDCVSSNVKSSRFSAMLCNIKEDD